MLRMLGVSVLVLCCAACERGGIDSYAEGVEAQNRVLMEMVAVLEGVDDEASAEKAADRIEALGERLGEIAAQVRAMPAPTMEEMQRISEQQRKLGREFQHKAASQMGKLAEYESLREAWSRAMNRMAAK